MSSPEHSLQSDQTGRPPRKHRRAQLAAVGALTALRLAAGRLHVRVPRHSAGVSPAWGTVPLTRKNLGALIWIAAGKSAAATSVKV